MGKINFDDRQRMRWIKWKMLSNGMRSLETPDIIPVLVVCISDGKRGRVGPELFEEQEIILWRDTGRGAVASNVPYALTAGITGSAVTIGI